MKKVLPNFRLQRAIVGGQKWGGAKSIIKNGAGQQQKQKIGNIKMLTSRIRCADMPQAFFVFVFQHFHFLIKNNQKRNNDENRPKTKSSKINWRIKKRLFGKNAKWQASC